MWWTWWNHLWFAKLKPSKLILTFWVICSLAKLFCQMLNKSKFAKLFYSIYRMLISQFGAQITELKSLPISHPYNDTQSPIYMPNFVHVKSSAGCIFMNQLQNRQSVMLNMYSSLLIIKLNKVDLNDLCIQWVYVCIWLLYHKHIYFHKCFKPNDSSSVHAEMNLKALQ